MTDRAWCKARADGGRRGLVPCGKRATRDGWCGTHHPDAVAARRARSDARIAAQMAHDKAKFARTAQRNGDAVRMAWLAEHYADSVPITADARQLIFASNIVRVWQWIDMHQLQHGGIRGCIDYLMNWDAKGGSDAKG